MTDTLAAIKAFAADKKALKDKPRAAFVPPTPFDFKTGVYLCLDQSLGNTGWAVLSIQPALVRVMASGMVHAPSGRSGGPQGTLEAVKPLVKEYGSILGNYRVDAIVYELPNVTGQRIESAMVAAAALEAAHLHHAVTTPMRPVARQHAAARLVGAKDASKKVTNAYVDSVVGIWRPQRPWNEHVRDAVLLGLAHALKEKP